MNTAKGQSFKKQHLSNGASTSCNLRTSFTNNEFDSFKWWAEKYPEVCCQKCLNSFTEKLNRLKK